MYVEDVFLLEVKTDTGRIAGFCVVGPPFTVMVALLSMEALERSSSAVRSSYTVNSRHVRSYVL